MTGHVVKRGNRYAVVLELGTPGRRRQKWVGGFVTKKEADKALRRMLHELETGRFVEPSKMTTAWWLDKWSKDHSSYLAPTTKAAYLSTVKSATQIIGDIPLQRLTCDDIESMYAQWERQGAAASTISTRHGILHGVFAKALTSGHIIRNPVDGARPPKVQRKRKEILTVEQTQILLRELEGTDLYVPTALAVATGMRRSEVLAARWRDLDTDSALLSVRATKTKQSNRVVSLPPFLMDVLKEHRKTQAADRLLAGNTWQDNDLIVCESLGGPIRPESLSRRFSRTMQKRGFDIVFHSLRHSHASHLLMAGVNPKVVQERLGHSTITMTMDTYSHVMPSMQARVAEAVQGMYEASGSKSVANLPRAAENACK